MYKTLALLALICIAQCNYKKKFAQSHNFDLSAEAQEQYLKAQLNCGSDTMKADTICYCGTLSLQCCASKAKCTGDTKKLCTEKKTECDNEIKTAMEYYKKENEEMKKLYCSEQADSTSICLCGMLDFSCCKSKDKCESKYGGLSRVCSDKTADANACNAKIETKITTPKKPWFYKRLVNSAYTLIMSFGLLAILALF